MELILSIHTKTPEEELIPVLVDSHHQHLHENNEKSLE